MVVIYYTNQYKGDYKLILSVKPGLTDFAKIETYRIKIRVGYAF